FCTFFFFFQAEDGIRDGHVTGVQTCALPIYQGYRMNETTQKLRTGFKVKHYHSRIPGLNYGLNGNFQRSNSGSFLLWQSDSLARSEERRVGKECRSRCSPESEKEK